MLVKAERVMFKGFRQAVSKKTGLESQYIDIISTDGELTVSSRTVDLSKIELLLPYTMSADIVFKRFGAGMYAVVNELSLTPFVPGKKRSDERD